MAKSDIDNFTEKRLLNTLFHQSEFIEDVQINEKLFSSTSTRNIYKALVELKKLAVPFTRDALLQQYAKLDIDASENIVNLISEPQKQKLETIKDIVIQLKDAQKRRKITSGLKEAIKKVEDITYLNEHNIVDIKDLIGDAESELTIDDYSTKNIQTFEDWAKQHDKELNIRKKGKQYYFYNFIFDDLIPDGPRPGEIGIIASASGSGKSALCLQLVNSLIETQIPCMYFSLEMSSISTMDRLLSKRLEVKYSDIVNPKDQGQFEDICDLIANEKKQLIENKKFRFSEDPSMSLNDLRKHVKKFQTEINQNYCIVIIDLLSMITDFTRVSNGLNFAQGIEVAINKLSAISKELNIHVIGVLQLNRAAESDVKVHDIKDLERFRPNRAQIKNANAFLERARWVVSTFRQRMYAELYLDAEQYEDMLDIIECSAVKINNAKIGKVTRGLFLPEYFSIESLPSMDESI